MPNVSQLSKYLKTVHVQDGDTIVFKDAGNIMTKTFKKDGKPDEVKEMLEITVEHGGLDKIYTPNGTSVNLLSAEFGPSTEGWIGKKAKLYVVPASNGKDMIIAKPVDAVDQITLD